MSLATMPATCHRCKGPIAPGEDIRRYNRPAVGTLYHAVCPTLAPKALAPIAQHAGALTADAIDAIVAKVTLALAPKASPASPSAEPKPSAEDDDCTYSQALVEDGYQPLGYDCPGHDWLPLASATRTIEDAITEYTLACRNLATLATGASDFYGCPIPEDTDTTEALARCMAGLAPSDAKALVRFAEGLRAGIIVAAEAMRGDANHRETVRKVSRDEWRAQQSTLSLAVLVDDDAADALIANEANMATLADAACHCGISTTNDDGLDCFAYDCAEHGAVKGQPWKEHK